MKNRNSDESEENLGSEDEAHKSDTNQWIDTNIRIFSLLNKFQLKTGGSPSAKNIA